MRFYNWFTPYDLQSELEPELSDGTVSNGAFQDFPAVIA